MRPSAPLLAAALSLVAGHAAGQDAGAADAPVAAAPPPLTICLAAAPEGLDPARGPVGSAPSFLTRQVFETLVAIGAGGRELEPRLALSWEVSADGREYTFRLREGVAFQETPDFEPSRPLGPDDVIYTFNRMIDPESFLRPAGAGGHTVGGLDIAAVVEKVEKAGDDAVRFRLKAPHSGFLHMLAMDFAGIQSAEYGARVLTARQSWMLDTHPVGTGPFRLTGLGRKETLVAPPGPPRKPDFAVTESEDGPVIRALPSIPVLDEDGTRAALDRIVLAAHETYWAGRPKADGLVVEVETDIAERYGRLVRGECHVMPSPADADLDSLARNPETEVVEAEGDDTLYLAFNAERPPLDDKWVRRGLAEAIDIDALAGIEALNGTRARAMVRTADAAPEPEPQVSDAEVATAHLSGAGAEAPKLRMLVPVTRPGAPMPLADAIAAEWKELRAEVTLAPTPWPEMMPALAKGDYDVALLAWRAETPDLALNYETLLTCDAVGTANASRWCDSTFEAGLAAVRAAVTPEARAEAVGKAAARVAAELPVLPLLHLKRRWAVRTEIEGLDAAALSASDFTRAAVKLPEPPAPAAPDIDPESGESAADRGAG